LPLALGIIFYMVPKVSGRPLNNYHLAAISFWVWVFVGGWSGIPVGARLPAWMPSVSTVATVVLLVPAIAILINLRATWLGSRAKEEGGVPFKFVSFAIFAFIVWAVASAIASLRSVAQVVEFTLFGMGVGQLATYGVVAMSLFGAIYFIVPRISGTEWRTNWLKLHFLLSAGGLALVVFAWVVGGIRQGTTWGASAGDFMSSVRAAVPFIGIGTLGFVLLLAGHLLVLSNIISVIRRCCAACCGCGKEDRK